MEIDLMKLPPWLNRKCRDQWERAAGILLFRRERKRGRGGSVFFTDEFQFRPEI